jgi:archaellum component FlaC
MINRTCFKCNEFVNDVWTLQLSDEKEKVEFSGHKDHIDELDNRIKMVKDLHKKSVQKVIKELDL